MVFVKKQTIRQTDNCINTQSHYSLRGAAATLGLGVDNCREVEVDERGRMCPLHLKKLVLEDREKGLSPFFVNCTSGTTVYGAFDPINSIADICEEFGLWLHIDVNILLMTSKRTLSLPFVTESLTHSLTYHFNMRIRS